MAVPSCLQYLSHHIIVEDSPLHRAHIITVLKLVSNICFSLSAFIPLDEKKPKCHFKGEENVCKILIEGVWWSYPEFNYELVKNICQYPVLFL